MNTLSYGLLSLLSKASFTGYDLMQNIQPFWPAKHSQIYPALAALNAEGYVEHIVVAQSDKPDKKVYNLTDKGKDALRHWLSEPTDDPVVRDELMLKLYCMEIGYPADVRRMLETRREYVREKLEFYLAKAETLNASSTDAMTGVRILLKKGILSLHADLEWIEWSLQQLPNHNSKGESGRS